MNAHTKRDGRSAVASFGVAFHVFYSVCGVVGVMRLYTV